MGFLPGFTPRRYQRRMPGVGTSVEHSLGANRRTFSTLHLWLPHSLQCDLMSHILLPMSWSAFRVTEDRCWSNRHTDVIGTKMDTPLRELTGEPHHWDGPNAVISGPLDASQESEYTDVLAPASDGTYDLGVLGWTWVRPAE